MIKNMKKPARAAHKTRSRTTSAPSYADAPAVLESDREAHLRELDELRSELMETPETQVEQADPGVSEKAIDLALVQQIEEHIAEIDHALAAAKKGTYGICEHCGQPIDPERLRILPETQLCVGCKKQLEKMAHHHRRQ